MKKTVFVGIFAFFALFVMFPMVVYAQDTIIRVGLLRSFANREVITIHNQSITVGNGTNVGFVPVQSLDSSNGFQVRNTGGQITISSGNEIVFTFVATVNQSAQVMVTGGMINMGDYTFRGIIEFQPAGGLVNAVNVISLEEYLFGVLPSEMSPSFHIEALRAQAVAARTFTMYRVGRSTHQGFDLCDLYHCQVYRGAGAEHEQTNRAVNDTRGLKMFHNNVIIFAAYFSSSGGGTDNSENVWVEARPYLRGVFSIDEHEPMVWTRTYTWAQINTALQNTTGANIGTATGISITQVGPTGRPLEMTVHGTTGNRVITREAINTFFAQAGQALPSRNFTLAGTATTTPVIVTDGWSTRQVSLMEARAVDQRNIATNVFSRYIFDGVTMRRIDTTTNIVSGGTGITINGRGWGHGVGMSQRGAEGMARQGFTFREILQHYYTGVEIR